MKYNLLTGANGFIGKAYQRYSKNNCIYGTTSFKKGFPFVQFEDEYKDINEKLEEYKVDNIIHAASIIPASFAEANFELYLKNIRMFNNILNYSFQNYPNKLIYLGGFGSMEDLNKRDCKDFYTLAKLTGEDFCSLLNAKGINTVTLRLPSPYGVGGNENSVIHKFIKQALKNETITLYNKGERTQNFINVKDVISAINLAENHNGTGTFTIADTKEYSMKQLAELIIKLTNSSSNINYIATDSKTEQPRNKLDFSINSATKELGFKPQISLEEGLKEIIGHYKTLLT